MLQLQGLSAADRILPIIDNENEINLNEKVKNLILRRQYSFR